MKARTRDAGRLGDVLLRPAVSTQAPAWSTRAATPWPRLPCPIRRKSRWVSAHQGVSHPRQHQLAGDVGHVRRRAGDGAADGDDPPSATATPMMPFSPAPVRPHGRRAPSARDARPVGHPVSPPLGLTGRKQHADLLAPPSPGRGRARPSPAKPHAVARAARLPATPWQAVRAPTPLGDPGLRKVLTTRRPEPTGYTHAQPPFRPARRPRHAALARPASPPTPSRSASSSRCRGRGRVRQLRPDGRRDRARVVNRAAACSAAGRSC